MPRPVTWDAVEGRRLWIAGMSSHRMAKVLGVDRQTINDYARRNRWPARAVVRAPLGRPARHEIPAKPSPVDTDIAAYRAEKAKRAHKEDARIAEAKRLLSLYGGDPLKAKRGRPKKNANAEDIAA